MGENIIAAGAFLEFATENPDERCITIAKSWAESEADRKLECFVEVLIDCMQQEKYESVNQFYDKFESHPLAQEESLTIANHEEFLFYCIVDDEQGEVVYQSSGKKCADYNLTQWEQLPFRYQGGISAFLEEEIFKKKPDAWVEEKSIEIRYEINFEQYFYKAKHLRTPKELAVEIQTLEQTSSKLIQDIFGGK